MPINRAAPATSTVMDTSESLRLRHGYAGKAQLREARWRSPHIERRTAIGLALVAILANLFWMVGLDRVMMPLAMHDVERGPIEVRIILPPEVFEVPPEPEPEPVEFRRRPSAIRIEPPQTTITPPPLTSESESQTQARMGSAGDLKLFNADGSISMPQAVTRIGPEPIANPQEAGKARWAEIEERGENPLDCKRTRFASAYAADESVGDKVSRKYLKWIGLGDPAVIAERAAKKRERAADGCDPAE